MIDVSLATSAPQVSFRDPSGCLVVAAGRVLRAVNVQGKADCEAFMASRAGRQLLADGDVVPTQCLSLAEEHNAELARRLFGSEPALLLEHERIPFRNYPYEWPPEMLHAAARLTVRIARLLLDNGLGLKDATPFNILFQGPKPVFVDLLSFEKREAGNAMWLPEAQFIRTFILPLLLYEHYRVSPHQQFLTGRDGVVPEDAYALASLFRRVTPSFLSWVSLPTWMGRTAERRRAVPPASDRSKTPNLEKTRFILGFLFRRLERSLAALAPGSGRRSTWSGYEACTHYDHAAGQAKEAFVASCLDRVKPTNVLDVGCNIGRFSRIAAKRGASVVAIDLDPVVVGQVWRMAAEEQLDILPLVQNLATPSPAMGWWNREYPSFLDRAEGRFQMVLLLAVVHHLIVTDRIPLDEIVDLAAHLSTQAVVVEYVGPEDEMFRRIARGREHLHAGLNPQTFQDGWTRRFRLVDSTPVPGTGRTIYLFAKPTRG